MSPWNYKAMTSLSKVTHVHQIDDGKTGDFFSFSCTLLSLCFADEMSGK